MMRCMSEVPSVVPFTDEYVDSWPPVQPDRSGFGWRVRVLDVSSCLTAEDVERGFGAIPGRDDRLTARRASAKADHVTRGSELRPSLVVRVAPALVLVQPERPSVRPTAEMV